MDAAIGHPANLYPPPPTPAAAPTPAPTPAAVQPDRTGATAVADAVGLLRLSGRVLRQHWPVLFALALFAEAVRSEVIVYAAELSWHHQELAYLLFAFGPLAYLIVVILMLNRARRSLPQLGPRTGSVVSQIALVLVPFLVFYSAAGFLASDKSHLFGEIANQATTHIAEQVLAAVDGAPLDEPNPGERIKNPEPVFPLVWVPVIILVVAGVRWLLGRSSFTRRHPIFAFPAAYAEALWLIVVASLVFKLWADPVLPWLERRRAWASTVDWLHSDFHAAGFLSAPIRAVLDVWMYVWSAVSGALLIPILALVTAAVIYGIQSEPKDRPARHRAASGPRAVGRVVFALPRNLVMSRVGPALSGARIMLRVGLVATAVFCVAYTVLTVLPVWLWRLERLIFGPQDFFGFWVPVSALTDRLNGAITTTLLVGLLAGAVGQIARRLTALDGVDPATATGPVTDQGSTNRM